MGFPTRFIIFSALALSFASGECLGYEQGQAKPDCKALIDANAGDPSKVDERCFLITSVRIDESEVEAPPQLTQSRLGDSASRWSSASAAGGGGGGLDEVSAAVGLADKITLIGGRIWSFIKDNQPTDEEKATNADALPGNLKNPSYLTGWSMPQVKQFRVVYTNLAGFDVIDFTYQVAYTYGGRLQGKKGYYLTNVQVKPGNLKVLWGFHFDFAGGAEKAINIGTQQDPVAGIEVSARWRAHSVLVTLASSESFFIKGNGKFDRISAEGQLP